MDFCYSEAINSLASGVSCNILDNAGKSVSRLSWGSDNYMYTPTCMVLLTRLAIKRLHAPKCKEEI